MKKIMINILLLLSILTLASCHAGQGGSDGAQGDRGGSHIADGEIGSSVSMLAKIDKLGEKLEVSVLESEYTFGTHWVITPDATKYYGKDGSPISRDDLKVGDTVEILYSGQVMMSLPPQIVAARISVK